MSDDEEDEGAEATAAKAAPISKFDRLRQRTNQDVLSTAFTKLRSTDHAEDEDDDAGGLLQLAPVQRHKSLKGPSGRSGSASDEDGEDDTDDADDALPPRPKSRKERAKKPTVVSVRRSELQGAGQRVVFDEEGKPMVQGPKLAGLDVGSSSVKDFVFAKKHEELEEAARDMSKADIIDREMYKERLRAKRREKRAKLRALRVPEGFEEGFGGVQLASLADPGDEPMSSDGEGSTGAPEHLLDDDFALLDEDHEVGSAQDVRKAGKRSAAAAVTRRSDAETDADADATSKPAKKKKSDKPLRSLEEEALGLLGQ